MDRREFLSLMVSGVSIAALPIRAAGAAPANPDSATLSFIGSAESGAPFTVARFGLTVEQMIDGDHSVTVYAERPVCITGWRIDFPVGDFIQKMKPEGFEKNFPRPINLAPKESVTLEFGQGPLFT